MSALALATLSIPAAQASSSGTVMAQDSATAKNPPTWMAVPDSSHSQTSRHNNISVMSGTPSKSRYLQAVTQRLRDGVSERRSAAFRHADYLGVARHKTAYRERETHGLLYLRFLKKKWAIRAHKLYKLRARSLRDFQVYPGSHAWHHAVDEAQRPYPNTSGWLLSCSASEGGHGRWVPNSQGSGVGGWMQMFPSTFWRMWATAKADTEARGFRVPASAASWYSPLGQALASAWGLTHGRRQEWHGAGC